MPLVWNFAHKYIQGKFYYSGNWAELDFEVVFLFEDIFIFVFRISQYNATNINQSTAKFQLEAELGTAQPQLVLTFVILLSC